MKFTLPITAKSTANLREHWAEKARRVKPQREAALRAVKSRLSELGPTRLVVLMTRVALSDGLDDDNLRSALKSLRDGIASALRVDDRSPLVRWDYAQRRGEYAVEVMISWETASDLDVAFPSEVVPPPASMSTPRPKDSRPLSNSSEPLERKLRRLARPATYRGGE
jgi:hypothetical protein